jgi:hypothetical protein
MAFCVDRVKAVVLAEINCHPRQALCAARGEQLYSAFSAVFLRVLCVLRFWGKLMVGSEPWSSFWTITIPSPITWSSI